MVDFTPVFQALGCAMVVIAILLIVIIVLVFA